MLNPLPPDILRARAYPREADMRGDYFRDVTAIIHSTPFRRLKHKTQAFYAPQNDHVCTRIEHVLHVATIAVTICKALGLDADLAQAIALAHDLGHAPFGHEGERVLHGRTAEIGGFIHELHGLRVVDVLAHDGTGLNLTYGVRDGVISHCGERFEQRLSPEPRQKALSEVRDRGQAPNTYEGCVVRLADKIAYLGRDLEDAITAKFVTLPEVDPLVRQALGSSNGQIIGTLVADVVQESLGRDYIGLSDEKNELVLKLYSFSRASTSTPAWSATACSVSALSKECLIICWTCSRGKDGTCRLMRAERFASTRSLGNTCGGCARSMKPMQCRRCVLSPTMWRA
ncbi:MAG: Deoxyguanosinetriphosphate triphosphohydrolase-like protein [Firmicutes bacterium]|nr:Deoxyguanosinetriphosphate triphosphohydrolase-like protein [candidate division NPL-UPA2 bacterium]